MFTGLIEGVGTLAAREARGGDARLRIGVGTLPFDNVQLGESISVNGTCLTVVAFDETGFEADASNETLALTTLGALPVGRALNLERAMRPGDRLGGGLASLKVSADGRTFLATSDRYGNIVATIPTPGAWVVAGSLLIVAGILVLELRRAVIPKDADA